MWNIIYRIEHKGCQFPGCCLFGIILTSSMYLARWRRCASWRSAVWRNSTGVSRAWSRACTSWLRRTAPLPHAAPLPLQASAPRSAPPSALHACITPHDTVGLVSAVWSPQHMRACTASLLMSMQGVQAEHQLPCRHSGSECLHLLKLRRCAVLQVAESIGVLEAELRRSKRREEKLAALQFRLREDLKQNGGNIG